MIDFNLPKLFSLELVRRLKESGARRSSCMAAKGDRKMALEALRSGANGFVLKSANGDHLLEALIRLPSAASTYPPNSNLSVSL